MKKFTEIDLKQKTYVDVLKENIHNIVEENVKIRSNNENEDDVKILIYDDIVEKIHELIQKEKVEERLRVYEEIKRDIFQGTNVQALNEKIDSLKK